MLRRAGVSPRPTARLFKRLSGEHRGGMFDSEFLASHPLSSDRARRFEAAFDKSQAYRPILDRAGTEALFDVCSKAPVAGE